MRRTYLFRRVRIAQLSGAVVTAVVLAGCGSSGGAASTPAAAVVAPTSTIASGDFDPSLVATTKKGSSSSSAASSSSGNSSSGGNSVSNASKALAVANGDAPSTTTATTTATTAKTTPAVATPPVVKTPTTRTVTRIVYRQSKPTIKYVTVTKYQTKTVTNTVTTPPKVPIGAFLPSVHAAMSLTSFIVQGRGVGCVIGGGSVRCDVSKHTWTPPAQPSSCTQAWGSGIVLINSNRARLPQFSCGGGSAINSHEKVVKNGYDVTVGAITCQVRGFGVDCFGTDKKGFILSATGYILY